jgi:hypothetical protein
VSDRRRSGDGQHHRRAREEPGKRDLRRRGAEPRGDPPELARAQERARSERKPGDERDAGLLAGGEDAVRRAVLQVVLVLHRHDGRDAARLLELAQVDVGHAEMTDLAGALQIGQRADRVGVRHLGIGRMQLVQIDALDAQALEAAVERAAQVLGAPIAVPAAGARAHQASLGANDDARGVGEERLGDDALGNLRAVAVGGVQEVDAELDGPDEQSLRSGAVGRIAPDFAAGHAHRPESHAVDREIAEAHGARRCRLLHRGIVHDGPILPAT